MGVPQDTPEVYAYAPSRDRVDRLEGTSSSLAARATSTRPSPRRRRSRTRSSAPAKVHVIPLPEETHALSAEAASCFNEVMARFFLDQLPP
jgi:hypothetical protein